ncbi:MAG: leucine-rich repeat domain-containing protein [Treponema sp.]|nr:leucine-rich repeat domain-containing protein [Treponema sp.]
MFLIKKTRRAIENELFAGCGRLSSVTIQEGITKIGYAAFQNCTNLRNISIPSSVKSVDEEAFAGCRTLRTIQYGGSKAGWRSIKKGEGAFPGSMNITCSDGDVTISR